MAHKNNIVIFETEDGKPCDDGSHMLAKDNKIIIDSSEGPEWQNKTSKQQTTKHNSLRDKNRNFSPSKKRNAQSDASIIVRRHARTKFINTFHFQNNQIRYPGYHKRPLAKFLLRLPRKDYRVRQPRNCTVCIQKK